MKSRLPLKRYEDEKFYYVRKPHGIPTTFGSQFSFLEEIQQQSPEFFVKLAEVWTREEEWGLLNRLDNETAGLIYFAKNKEIAERYYALQDAGRVNKWYICDIQGDMRRFVNTDTHVMWCDLPSGDEKALCTTYPIMHHAHDDQKMIAIHNPADENKGRGKQHMVKTYFIPLFYDEEKNQTTAYAHISKGIRHQIRTHAAAAGYPLVGDYLYRGAQSDVLHLRSVGVSIEDA